MNQGFSKNQIIAIVAIISVVFTVIVLSLTLLNTPIYIKSLGNSLEQNGAIVNTITVSGDGKVTVRPDMATVTFSISESDSTSQGALSKANAKMNQILEILNGNSIPENDIQTSQFSIYPEYEYSTNTPIIKGQKATIGVTVKIKGIDSKASKATQIIDQISEVQNVQMGSIYFDLENKEQAYNQARESAFSKAKQKAEDLARLSGVKLLKPVSITDYSTNVSNPAPLYAAAEALTSKSFDSTSLSTGDLDLSININVVFGID